MKLQLCTQVLTITINAYREIDDEVEYLNDFNENDPDIIYDVTAYADDLDEPYSIEASKELLKNKLLIYACLICPVLRYTTLKYDSIPAVVCLVQNK